jgi:ABC-type Mn2+/Zn2+ transport system permease subunit
VDLAALPNPADLVELRPLRLALVELSLLALAGGILGAFVVLRELAFFTHAAGAAAFPGAVVAQAASVSPRWAALATALGFAGGVERAGRGGRDPGGAATGLLLVAALGVGTILAGDVFRSGAAADRLLFGSVIALDGGDLALSAVAAALAVGGALLLGRAWTAVAIDPSGARSLGWPVARADLALLVLVAVVVAAALPAVGALLVTSLLVVPAAIARLLARSVRELQAMAVAVGLVQGVVGLYAALWLDVPPGPAVAVLGAAAYGVCAVGLASRAAIPPRGVEAAAR